MSNPLWKIKKDAGQSCEYNVLTALLRESEQDGWSNTHSSTNKKDLLSISYEIKNRDSSTWSKKQ